MWVANKPIESRPQRENVIVREMRSEHDYRAPLVGTERHNHLCIQPEIDTNV